MIRQCAVCGEDFEVGHHLQKYCTETCRRKANRQTGTKEVRICQYCGKEFETTSRIARFCSNACGTTKKPEQRKHQLRQCVICGKEFWPTHKNSACCSKPCAGKLSRKKRGDAACQYCGKTISQKNQAQHAATCPKKPSIMAELRTFLDNGNGKAKGQWLYSKNKPDNLPSIALITTVFGSWKQMCEELGLTMSEFSRKSHKPIKSKRDQQEAANLERLARESDATQRKLREAYAERWNYSFSVSKQRTDGDSVIYTLR